MLNNVSQYDSPVGIGRPAEITGCERGRDHHTYTRTYTRSRAFINLTINRTYDYGGFTYRLLLQRVLGEREGEAGIGGWLEHAAK